MLADFERMLILLHILFFLVNLRPKFDFRNLQLFVEDFFLIFLHNRKFRQNYFILWQNASSNIILKNVFCGIIHAKWKDFFFIFKPQTSSVIILKFFTSNVKEIWDKLQINLAHVVEDPAVRRNGFALPSPICIWSAIILLVQQQNLFLKMHVYWVLRAMKKRECKK